jgi:predicted dehydrogenase
MAGVLGTRSIGNMHIDAARRFDSVEAAAIVDTKLDEAQRSGRGFSILKVMADNRTVLNEAVNPARNLICVIPADAKGCLRKYPVLLLF